MQAISIAFVSDLKQCQLAISADVDAVCVNMENTSGLDVADRSERLLISIGHINELLRYVKARAPHIIRFIRGSNSDSAELVDYVLRTTQAQGYSTGDIRDDIINYYCDNRKAASTPENEMLKPVDIVLSYIDEHYGEKLVFSNLADMVYISRSYLSRLFVKRVGKPFSSYLAELRMEKAKELFAAGICRWKTIAQMLGYADYAHFSKTFYKHVGCWPTEYAQQVSVTPPKQY